MRKIEATVRVQRHSTVAALIPVTLEVSDDMKDGPDLDAMIRAAAEHKGSAVVEIWQNCVIFNDKVHEPWVGKDTRDDNLVLLENGQPMVYGKDKERGIVFDCGEPREVPAAEASTWRSDTPTPAPATVIAEMDMFENLPRAIGIFRDVDMPVFDREIHRQVAEAKKARPGADLKDLIYTKDVWEVE